MSRPVPAKRTLPSKEASLFKDLLSLYESRQLKKALKTADQILKKCPEHGETICMKGLVLTHMGRRDEGIDLVKQGMRLDLTSHICWHVFGLIQKGEKNYDEALKSYTQALKFDKDNLNILRDAAHLQTQLRVFDALIDTRHTILRLRPNFRQHWIALAVAYHLNGNLLEAKKVLETYERTLKNIPDYDVEHSESLLYHIRVLEDLGEFKDALDKLDTSAKERSILDRTAILEYRARLLTKLQAPEAEFAWRALIDHNPDCYEYYRGYLSQKNLSLSSANPSSEEALELLQTLSTQIPRAAAPKRLALTLATGPAFSSLIKPYMTSALQKGIPSLFSDLKSLYSPTNPEKQNTIQTILEAELDGEEAADPSTYLWTLYYLAQHHSYLGDHVKALEVLDRAIEHTPTLPDLLMFKGRVLKRCGDYLGAARMLNEARLLDGQDRFLNTKTGKYLLRAGLVEEASGIFGLFTKKDAASPGADLEDMQSFLYILEEANAHRINNKLNLALKKYMAVVKVIESFEDDQYDFHGYNLRKFTVNIYLNLITWEDHIRAQPVYVRAALAAAKIFLEVHDDPSIAQAAAAVPELTEAEKKAKKKAKKAASKAEDNKKAQQQQNANEDKGLEPPTKDDDPDGTKLLTSPSGLETAAKLLRPLTNLLTTAKVDIAEKERMEIWLLSYDVAIRRRKLLQALTSLTHAQTLNSAHPGLHLRLVHLHHFIRTTLLNPSSSPSNPNGSPNPTGPPAPIGPAFLEGVKQLGVPDESQVSLETYNQQYLQKHAYPSPSDASKAEVVVACAKAMIILGAPLHEVENLLLGIVSTSGVGDGDGLTIGLALEIGEMLKGLASGREEEFREGCRRVFVRSTVFGVGGEEEVRVLREGVLRDPDVAVGADEVLSV
ncbi:N-terminal acetyltransferase A, auxiliary subunit [Macrolepiota fuliginosa MF-IS2]|uniref:N-terminal acetyltransferase A, auxiliary subunit n=1 Tax=Macrolepiota fuliginosa MF-IS2 TaxID=1400762 RepID=A0A9P5X3D8_9AGAR|nr:N-terminal acetyltransferase A, auxiliary subunit [Macrolepiota fuliginosa MF-IS2]